MINFYLATLAVGFFIAPVKMMVGGWIPYLVMDGMVLALVVYGLSQAMQHHGPGRVPIAGAYIALALYCLTGLINPEGVFLRGVMGLRSLLLYPALMFAGFAAFNTERHLNTVYRLVIILGVATALVGIWQWNTGPQAVAAWGGSYEAFSRRMVWTRGDSGVLVFRPFSTFAQAGVFGATMTLAGLIVVSELLATGVTFWRRITLGVAVSIITTGLLVSASRLSMIELIGGTLLMVMLATGVARRTWLAIQGAIILFGGLWVATSLAGTVFAERFQGLNTPAIYIWRWLNPLREGFRLALDHPLGLGPGYAGGLPFFVSDSWIADLGGAFVRNVDSGIGSIAAEYGLPGVALFLFFFVRLVVIAVASWRSLAPGPFKDRLRAPVAFAVIGLAVTPIADMMRPGIPTAIIYWFTLGMLMRAPLLERQRRLASAMQKAPYGAGLERLPRQHPVQRPAALSSHLVKPLARPAR